jgi:hypothetical protein
MNALIERLYWWWMLKTSNVHVIAGLRFLYISAENDRPAAEIRAALADALEQISVARGGFGELVGSHLKFVVALNTQDARVLRYARGYVTSFPTLEIINPHYLACRLIWAATYVRLVHDMIVHRLTIDLRQVREASRTAQLRFIGQFPDAAEWRAYLERHVDGI